MNNRHLNIRVFSGFCVSLLVLAATSELRDQTSFAVKSGGYRFYWGIVKDSAALVKERPRVRVRIWKAMDSCGSSFSHDAPESPESALIGGPIQKNDELAALADPITYIDATDPPFLILHGDADELVPHCQSILLHDALKAKGVQSKLVIVPKGGHGPGLWIDQYSKGEAEV